MLNSKQEKGKRIRGFEKHYAVSSKGRISNFRKIMATYEINSGYLAIKFTVNGVRSSHLVHRLVAEAFIPNPDGKAEVNHKDGNKHNNCVENLEWVSSSENKHHAYETGLKEYNNPSLGKKLGKQSKFHNVTYDKSRKKFVGCVRHGGKNFYSRRFNTEISAAAHVNWILDTLGLTNRPRNIV